MVHKMKCAPGTLLGYARQMMISSFLLFVISSFSAYAQTVLTPGDICMVGYYRVSGTNAGFSFVTLRKITKGTFVYFTDKGTNGTNGWIDSNEGYLKWTIGNASGQDLEAGAIVTVVSPQSAGGMAVNMRNAGGATSTITAEFVNSSSPSNGFSLGAGGDPILVFQTKSADKNFDQITDVKLPIAEVNFITGITTDYNPLTINSITKWNNENGPTSANESTVPPGLANGTDCISLGTAGMNENYALYTGPLNGSKQQIAANINDAGNWNLISSATTATTITLSNFAANISLPVTFGKVQVVIKEDKLLVNWQTEKETNNDHFEIEASKDGKTFTTIATIPSKAINGNSEEKITYEWTSGVALSLSVVPLFTLLLGSFIPLRRKAVPRLVIAVIVIISIGCNKSSGDISTTDSYYVRIAQVDKDGATTYSKVVRASKK